MPADTVASVQVDAGVNDPLPLVVNLTLPVGVVMVPALVSVTVALHDVATAVSTLAGEQLTAVAVVRLVTVSGVPPMLAAWTVSAEPGA